ncbi:MAG: hypothetical protein HFH29_06600 [Eubacterium sp.]|nr:hypothetical protein [Eubacterium sp.]
MDSRKLLTVVKGYLWKDKKSTIFSSLFLCFVTMFLLVGNQLFLNVQTADRLNAEALEGRQHAAYFDLSQEEFLKIKSCSFVAQAGRSVYIGRSEDGTSFAYIDENFRDLGAAVADGNIKKAEKGRWAEHKNEAVFTENFMQLHGLELGDTITVDLAAEDSDTGDLLFRVNGLTLTAVGIIGQETGFTDRKAAYVSQTLADDVIRKYGGNVNAVVRFDRQDKITQYFDRLNAYLGYEGESADTLNAKKNQMLIYAEDNGGALKRQNRIMNLAVWLISVLVVYNIFYSRLFEKKKDFINLRKIGFRSRDLLKIAGAEFLILACIGAVTGISAGYFVNKAVYGRVMEAFIDTYDAGGYVSSDLSISSICGTGIMLVLVSVPGIASALLQLQNTAPVEMMRGRRKNTRKVVLSLAIVSLSAVLISILGVQDNQSDSGVLYVKEYVPGDLQLTAGSISENIFGGSIPSVSDQVYEEIKKIPGIAQVQDYKINYDNGIFVCKKKSDLNAEGGFYENMLDMEQEIDGQKQCLYNVILVTTDNMNILAGSYDEQKDGRAAIIDGELAETLNLRIGDTFTLYDEQLVGNGSADGCTSAEVTILDTWNIVLSENHLGGNLIIVDPITAGLFSGSLHRQVVNVWDSNDSGAGCESELEQISQDYGYSFHSAERQIQKYAQSDKIQKAMHCFFIIVLVLTGLITYFNTVFTNLLDCRNDFSVMHKIGIRKAEMYWMSVKEGIKQGTAAAAAVGAVQAVLCIGGFCRFHALFAVTDAGIILAGVLFPVLILSYLLQKM